MGGRCHELEVCRAVDGVADEGRLVAERHPGLVRLLAHEPVLLVAVSATGHARSGVAQRVVRGVSHLNVGYLSRSEVETMASTAWSVSVTMSAAGMLSGSAG